MSRDLPQFTGEFRLEEALVTSPTGEVTDLMTDLQIVEINLFESLIRNTISGSIIVVDTRNVVVKLPIIGQEDLSLKIVTPSLKKKEDILDFTENTFFIHKIAKREEVSVGAQTYELSFVSDAAIINSSKRLSRSYVGSKANIGEMVEDILKKDLGVPSDRNIAFALEATSSVGKSVSSTSVAQVCFRSDFEHVHLQLAPPKRPKSIVFFDSVC